MSSTAIEHKQGLYLPGTRLEVFPPQRLAETRPDYLLILPWNLRTRSSRRRVSLRTGKDDL